MTDIADAFDMFKAVQEQMQKEEQEKCGTRPPPATSFDELFKNEKFKANEKFSQCYARLQHERTRSAEKIVEDQRKNIFNIHQACRAAVKKLVQSSETISFKPYNDQVFGYNYADVYPTEGGYSVDISGSHVGGNFNVRCYMDKRLTVTAVR